MVIVLAHPHVFRQAGLESLGADTGQIQSLGGFQFIMVDANGGFLMGGQLQLEVRSGFHSISGLGIDAQTGIFGGCFRCVRIGFLGAGAEAENQRKAQEQGK